MPSFSTEDRSETSSNESIILDLSKIKTYGLEPIWSPLFFFVGMRAWEWSRRTRKNRKRRFVSMRWMQAYGCMATYTESLSCQDTNEVSEVLCEGQKCITTPSGFKMVCSEKPVLHASLWALNHLHGDSMENLGNSSYRFAGCKHYSFRVNNFLGKGVR